MLKKVIPIVLSLCLILSVSALEESQNQTRGGAETKDFRQVMQEEQDDINMSSMGDMQNGNTQSSAQNVNPQFGGQMPEGMGRFQGNMQSSNQNADAEKPEDFRSFVKTYSTPITSVVLLGLAFIFVIFYRRKNY